MKRIARMAAIAATSIAAALAATGCRSRQSIATLPAIGGQPVADSEAANVSQTTLIVSYDSAAIGRSQIEAEARRRKATVIYSYRIISAIAVKIAPGADIEAERRAFARLRGVTAVERDRVMHLDSGAPQ